MRKLLKWGVIGLICLGLVKIIGAVLPDPPKEQANTTLSAKDTTMLKRVAFVSQIKKEKKVKEALLTDANVLYVSVEKDKSDNRHGYAMYICQEANLAKIKIDRVKVVEYGTTNAADRDNAYGRILGACWCETYKIGY